MGFRVDLNSQLYLIRSNMELKISFWVTLWAFSALKSAKLNGI
jgi:hypothetical protein